METIERNDTRPISVLRQSPGSFYVVKKDNPNYVSQNGCLYSKDYKKIQYVPRGLYGTFVIPEGTEVIDVCCFEKTNFDQIIIPSSLKSQRMIWCFNLICNVFCLNKSILKKSCYSGSSFFFFVNHNNYSLYLNCSGAL